MTDGATTGRSGGSSGRRFGRDLWIVLKRWLLKTTRNPFVVVSSLIQPIIFLVLFTEVFGQVTGGALEEAIGMDVSYITFLTPAIIIQSALVAAAGSGIGLVDDMENGMFEKMLVSPLNRGAIFLGKALSEVVRIVFQTAIILVLGFGLLYLNEGNATFVETGILGVVGIIAITIVFAVWFTAFSNVVAIITQDQESTIIGANLLTFPLLFVSSAFLPVEVLPGWIQTVAALNPITYGVDAVRSIMLGRDVMTVIEVSAFGGVWDALVPATVVLLALDLAFGIVAVVLLTRTASSDVE